MINWDHLRIVLAIRDGGSLHAAAERLGLDRATVIRRLDALEAGLGARLFDRGRDGCSLTVAGQSAISTVEAMEAAVTRMGHEVGGDSGKASGTVTVAMPEFVAVNLVAPALPRLRASHPEIAVSILTGFEMLNLARGAADIALRNRLPVQNTLVARRLVDGALAFFASPDYLASRGGTEAGFAGHDLILPDEEAMRLPIFGGAEEISAAGRVVLRVSDTATALAAANAGLGVALLPCGALPISSTLEPVWPGIVAHTQSWLVTHRDLRRQTRVRVVMDFLARLHRAHAATIGGAAIAARFASVGGQS